MNDRAQSVPSPTFDLNSGVLAPVHDEVLVTDPDVVGKIPPELNGTLIRNGPNPFGGQFAGHSMLDWWVGSAMLHGVAFEGGEALWYRNRWIRSGQYRRHFESPVAMNPESDQNTNVNVVFHSGQILALGEGSLPFAVTPELETLGSARINRTLPGGMTAHPKIDPESGEMVLFRGDWQAPYLSYGVLQRDGEPLVSQAVAIESPCMMHDFAITKHYSIFLDLSVGFDFSLLQSGAPMPLRWLDHRPSRLGVLPRHGGQPVWFEIEPCFIQHVVNAWDGPGGEVVIEAVRYQEFLRFDRATGRFAANPLGYLWRYSMNVDTGKVTETQVDDRAIELPRIDERRTGRQSGYLYAVMQPSDREMRGVVRYDRATGTSEQHSIPEGDQNSEPIFVPRNIDSAEDDGFVLTCVYRRDTDTTDVLILDAANIAREPLATVRLPRRIPAGFHGAWLGPEALGALG